jgi:acetolactate synthase-1/3 small subunit
MPSTPSLTNADTDIPQLLDLDELDAIADLYSGRKHILSLLVENRPSTLARIVGLFARRGFNIETLTVGPTADQSLSRVTLTVDGALHSIDQVTKQLHKLINVLSIRDLEGDETIERQLALFKVTLANETSRSELMALVSVFRGAVVDSSSHALVIEITGSEDKIAAFEEKVQSHGIIEMMRTGAVAMARGERQT